MIELTKSDNNDGKIIFFSISNLDFITEVRRSVCSNPNIPKEDKSDI